MIYITGELPRSVLPDLHNLRTVDVIDDLSGSELVAYLQGYGVTLLPVGANQVATDSLMMRKGKFKEMTRNWY